MALRKRGGGGFFKFASKRGGYPERGGFPHKRGGSNPGGNYVSTGPKVPDSTARVTYLSMRMHPKCCIIFPLKVETLLGGSRKGTVR